MILCCLGYFFAKFNTLNYIYIINEKFSNKETYILFFIFTVGFGVKIPLAPFHMWLLKVHVESPTSFSIFLSGFLVKSALYCLFIFLSILNIKLISPTLCIWIFYSLIVGTLGLCLQTDIKKLIAWATIQEMTFMLVFIVFKNIILNHTCIIFIIFHGLMSTYMFYLVDILQRRFKTRVLNIIQGTNLFLPKISKYIWILILLFSGFPLTVKFFIEWNLITLMIQSKYLNLLYLIIFVNFLGSIFFCRIMFMILYGTPDLKDEERPEIFTDLHRKEYFLLNFLLFLMLVLLNVIFFL
jgi:NADH-quinone oxidoreductase subunit M